MHEEEPLISLGLSSPKPVDSAIPATDSLQFQTAEFTARSGPRCTICQAEIGDTYYHLSGSVICPLCASEKQANLEPVRGRAFWKAVVYGAGAALGGSALYGIVLLATGAEFALLSILVGIMVGKAMLRGSGGRGGRKLQIVAVLLTYGSITLGYVPTIVKTLYEKSKTATAAPSKSGAAPTNPADAPKQPTGAGNALLTLTIFFGLVAGLAFVAPFLSLTSGFSGILGVLIIFFGLQQAWKKTAGEAGALMGPYASAELSSTAAQA